MEHNGSYTYTQAFDELQQIVLDIERGEIPIDELSAKVKQAKALIEICKSKLVDTEEDVGKLLSNLESDGKNLLEP